MNRTAAGISTDLWRWLVGVVGEPDSMWAPSEGSYNSNYVLGFADGSRLILRIPIPHAREVDLRVMPEADVLRRLEGRAAPFAPRLRAAGPGAALLLEFVGTELLDDVSDRQGPIRDFELDQLGDALACLHADAWGLEEAFRRELRLRGAHATSTYEINREHLVSTWDAIWGRYEPTLRRLGLPSPHSLLEILDADVGERAPGLLHGDVHRKNLRTDRTGGRLHLIDWEMAQVGDPVYDVAVALWKLKLPPTQEERLISTWVAALPVESTRGWKTALPAYVRQETIKTACIHLVRSVDRMLLGSGDDDSVASGYTDNLRDASAYLPEIETNPDQVLDALRLLVAREAK